MRHRTLPIPTKRRRLKQNVLLATVIVVLAAGLMSTAAPGPANARTPVTSDSLYNANHPRLLFDAGDLTALYNKVRDGGHDDQAYQFIRIMVDIIWPGDDEAGSRQGLLRHALRRRPTRPSVGSGPRAT